MLAACARRRVQRALDAIAYQLASTAGPAAGPARANRALPEGAIFAAAALRGSAIRRCSSISRPCRTPTTCWRSIASAATGRDRESTSRAALSRAVYARWRSGALYFEAT